MLLFPLTWFPYGVERSLRDSAGMPGCSRGRRLFGGLRGLCDGGSWMVAHPSGQFHHGALDVLAGDPFFAIGIG